MGLQSGGGGGGEGEGKGRLVSVLLNVGIHTLAPFCLKVCVDSIKIEFIGIWKCWYLEAGNP